MLLKVATNCVKGERVSAELGTQKSYLEGSLKCVIDVSHTPLAYNEDA